MEDASQPAEQASPAASVVPPASMAALEGTGPPNPPEKKDILYFPLRYTRIRNYWGFPELAFDDVLNDPQEIQVEYCESDPKVFDFFIRSTFIKDIVALYEPVTKTLVRREDIMKIKDMKLPNGRDTIWSVVYKGPEKKMGMWDNLAWASKLILKEEFSPMLYIEDLERGRYNDTLYDVVRWYLVDTVYQSKKSSSEQGTSEERPSATE